MQLLFFDKPQTRDSLKPFALTRPIADIRVGILTIAAKWKTYWEAPSSTGYVTENYLSGKYGASVEDDNLFIDGATCPDESLTAALKSMDINSTLTCQEEIIAIRLDKQVASHFCEQVKQLSDYQEFDHLLKSIASELPTTSYPAEVVQLTSNWDIFQQNGPQIAADFEQVTKKRVSEKISDPHTIVYHPENVFVEPGAKIRAAIINAENGPVYIGKNATIHENAVIIGPFAMLDNAHVNIGSKIREATTLGPYCKVGGEVKNSVFFSNSNKGHEGFIGNAVIGEWCNFGADSNCSNLKNNYKIVDIYHYGKKAYTSTGDLFCGLMMGDHSKCGINTMFNTGTVVGVSCNIYGADYPPKFVPSFTWGGAGNQEVYRLEKALEVAQNVVKRRGIQLPEEDVRILSHIYHNRSTE